MNGLIVAAGQGTRLRDKAICKPLIKIVGTPLIERVIASARRAGIETFTVVSGYRGDLLRTALDDFAARDNVAIRHVINDDWERPNGVSVYKAKGLSTGGSDEGGFAHDLKSNEQAVEMILDGIQKAGYKPGKDISIALDPAASEFYEDGFYHFKKSDNSKKSSEDMVRFYADWVKQYPIISIEDGLAEDDWTGWKLMRSEEHTSELQSH